jgi:hypothetical protein
LAARHEVLGAVVTEPFKNRLMHTGGVVVETPKL